MSASKSISGTKMDSGSKRNEIRHWFRIRLSCARGGHDKRDTRNCKVKRMMRNFRSGKEIGKSCFDFNSFAWAFVVALQTSTILRAILNLHITALETHAP